MTPSKIVERPEDAPGAGVASALDVSLQQGASNEDAGKAGKSTTESALVSLQQRRLEAKREYNRKNAALTRQRTKAHIEDLHNQLSDSTAKNALLTKMNADLVRQVELLTQENFALRQGLSINSMQGVGGDSINSLQGVGAGRGMSHPMPFMSNTRPQLDISALTYGGLGGPQAAAGNSQLLAAARHNMTEPMLLDRLFPSAIGAGNFLGQQQQQQHPGRESQTQLLHALLMQQERDRERVKLRDRMEGNY